MCSTSTELTLGAGAGGRSFSLTALPEAAAVPWAALRDIPTAIVTGSNGKTTTVRLLAACARAHGWQAGYNCTDGVFLDDETLAVGDYSGPAGARRVMREQPHRGGHSRNRTRRHFAPRNRHFAVRRRGRHQREFGSFRRIRHPRSRRSGGRQAGGCTCRGSGRHAGAERRRCTTARARRPTIRRQHADGLVRPKCASRTADRASLPRRLHLRGARGTAAAKPWRRGARSWAHRRHAPVDGRHCDL